MSSAEQSTGRSIGAIALIVLGAMFLFGQLFNISLIGIFWPFFIILPGAGFLYAALRGDRKVSGLAVPGAFITGTGGILLYQSLTGHWESWAYVWTLYALFLGWALSFMAERGGDESLMKVGQGFTRFGTMAFIGFWFLFEVLIFGGGGFLSNLAMPLVLIGLGIFMLSRPKTSLQKHSAGSIKRKHNLDDSVFTGPLVINGASSNRAYSSIKGDRLRQEIDAALAEDDDEPKSE